MIAVALADRAADLLDAVDAVNSLEPPFAPPLAALLDAALVVTDERQYARAAAHGLVGRVGDLCFDGVIFDGVRFRLAQHCEDQRGAEIAFLFPARDAEGEIVDVVAWVPETGKIATLLGEIGTLGLSRLDGPVLLPPIVHDSLLDWLLAPDDGFFVIEAKLAARELGGVTIAATDREAALRLRARLAPYCTKPPKIVVPKTARAA